MLKRGAAAAVLAMALLGAPTAGQAQTFLRAEGTRIVNEAGEPVILRGMGLGGWVLQEGYMLELGELGQQHVIRARIAELIGEEKTEAFYAAWRANHVTKADIDAMGRWGFNSVRLPMHYDRLTLPADREPVPGRDTWNEEGFRQIDDLLAWVKANGMYLILDLHAAPGGQGSDLAISDRDPSKPSLWTAPRTRGRPSPCGVGWPNATPTNRRSAPMTSSTNRTGTSRDRAAGTAARRRRTSRCAT